MRALILASIRCSALERVPESFQKLPWLDLSIEVATCLARIFSSGGQLPGGVRMNFPIRPLLADKS
jgi:hypothetical protein